MAKKQRNLQGNKVQDPSAISNLAYSEASGARKSSEVGRHLLPIQDIAGAYTTNATTAVPLPSAGRNIAVYNNSAAVHSITLGEDNTVVAQAAGAIQAGTAHVGIPCPPAAWTYIALGEQNWIVADSATLLVFLIDDDTYIRQEASK